jgi:hypothetical protein
MPYFAKPPSPTLQRGHSRARGLVGGWPIHERGATNRDLSGYGNHLTATAPSVVSGPFGPALSISTANSTWAAPMTPSLRANAALTIGAWIYSTAFAGPQTIASRFTFADQGSLGLTLILRTNASAQVEFYLGTASGFSALTGPALSLNTWYRLVVTWDGASRRINLNGVQVASGSFAGTLLDSDSPLRIGASGWQGTGPNEMWVGLIDAPIYANRAWSATEVAADYADAFEPYRPRRLVPTLAGVLPPTGGPWMFFSDNTLSGGMDSRGGVLG